MTASLAFAFFASAFAGCGGDAAPSGPAADLRITRDHGNRELSSHEDEPIPAPGKTKIMQLLRNHEEVTTATYFDIVDSIDGLRQDMESEDDPTRWVLNVNGIESDIDAVDYYVYPGDMIQFDLSYWDTTLTTRATVGAFPQTFTRGMYGERFPVRLECARPASAPCRRVDRRLRAAGLRPDGSPPPPPAPHVVPQPDIPSQIRRSKVLVGTWAQLRNWRWMDRIDEGPRYSGVFATFTANSRRLRLYDPSGSVRQTEATGTGMIAAMKPTGEDLVWLVTGVDELGVERASHALDSADLLDAFAVVVTKAGVRKIPLVDLDDGSP